MFLIFFGTIWSMQRNLPEHPWFETCRAPIRASWHTFLGNTKMPWAMLMYACGTAQGFSAPSQSPCWFVLCQSFLEGAKKPVQSEGRGDPCYLAKTEYYWEEQTLLFVVVFDRQSHSQLLRISLVCLTEAVKSQNWPHRGRTSCDFTGVECQLPQHILQRISGTGSKGTTRMENCWRGLSWCCKVNCGLLLICFQDYI